MSLTVTIADVRKLLESGAEQPVLYVNTEDGPAHVDVWAGALVQHHLVIATREAITDALGDSPTDDEIGDYLDDLQETADGIEP